MSTETNNPAVWGGYEPPEGMLLAWRAVHPDGRSRGDFHWPFKGVVKVAAKNIDRDHKGACPSRNGDGLCLARSWLGAASGGIPAITGLAVAYRETNVLGSDEDKLRVSHCRVLGPLDIPRLLRQAKGRGAILSGANLSGANLSEANLSRANLSRADLSRAINVPSTVNR